MALKDAWNVLFGKPTATEIAREDPTAMAAVASDAFPVVKVQEGQLSAYKQIPLASLAALGAAFSQLPEGARTIVQSTQRTLATGEPLFRGIWPKGIYGTMTDRGLGFSGNIVGSSGGIVGRMRFKAIEGLPVNETVSTVMPIDPMLMIVAIALMTIEKKLDGIQESVEEVLQFLKQEKQSKQRGNLNMLSEIMEDYKQHCQN